MKFTVLLLTLFSLVNASAQYAIVADTDSFTNIRSGAGKQYPVLDSLKNGSIVFLYEAEGNWCPIDYGFENKKFKSGWIYISKTKPLDAFTPIPALVSNDSVLIYQWDSCKMTITERNFKPAKHKFKYLLQEDGDSSVINIDGKQFWGTDGYMPETEYGKCQLKTGKKIVNLPIVTLYNPNLDLTNLYIDRSSNTLYLVAYNSDGAGGYAVLWVMKNGNLINQCITYGF